MMFSIGAGRGQQHESSQPLLQWLSQKAACAQGRARYGNVQDCLDLRRRCAQGIDDLLQLIL